MNNPVRCISTTNSNDWGYYPEEFARNKAWQRSTGLIPDDLPADKTNPLVLTDIQKPIQDAPVEILEGIPQFTEGEVKPTATPINGAIVPIESTPEKKRGPKSKIYSN